MSCVPHVSGEAERRASAADKVLRPRRITQSAVNQSECTKTYPCLYRLNYSKPYIVALWAPLSKSGMISPATACLR